MFGCSFTTVENVIHPANGDSVLLIRRKILMPIYHLVKCEDRVGGWGIQIMQYLIKILPKEAADILNNCGTDGHATLQLIHLQLHTLHFLFQIDECCVISVQGTKGFAKYTSGVKYY